MPLSPIATRALGAISVVMEHSPHPQKVALVEAVYTQVVLDALEHGVLIDEAAVELLTLFCVSLNTMREKRGIEDALDLNVGAVAAVAKIAKERGFLS